MKTPQYAATRKPFDFGKPFDDRKPLQTSPLQHAVLEGHKAIDEAVADFRANIIVWALRKHRGNQAAAARKLGINRTTMVEMLKTIGMHPRQIKKDYKLGDYTVAQATMREILDGVD